VQRGYERRGFAAWLAGVAGLVGRLLGSPASAQLGAADAASPVGLSGARINPGRRGLLAMAVVTVLTVMVAGAWVLAARPHPMLASATPGTSPLDAGASASLVPGGSLTSPRAAPTGSTGSGAGSTAAGSALLVVDVAGKVRRPGVYRLPSGARVEDAVRAAGGFMSGVDPVTVNLARKLVDGEQVLIGVVGGDAAASAGTADPGSGPAATTGPLDLNSATLAQLDALPGVGPVLAQHILDWRTWHGRFDSVDQLNGVSGIGDSKFADLKPLVTVG
jgi:competence protein ComEA